ncbi:major facilitator superfamily domain-containing protein [Cokeromyces recurvatus]|uniref:major facilitator superfamily domain-containing protein n=1 Tax=Cokeromyces recurvatus TaxID=90255 RepID=UPI00221F8BC5|nr:major facilitator superfamily domain-containing protein [Cokeromyces recurvatus]KAI7904083.1 major facilitator superfamily domain-containing protein [Cokeromyces recurvatus]
MRQSYNTSLPVIQSRDDVLFKSDILKEEKKDDDSGFSYSSLSSNQSHSNNGDKAINPHYNEQEKKLVRKLDLRIMPLFCLFYFADILDRANIGNATLAGLQTDLKMSSSELSTTISAFFITYIIFEIPSNIILKKVNAAKWLSFIMLVWGLATLLAAFVTNFTGLLIVRLILGAAESGYIPGILFLMSQFYTPKEYGFRVSILLTMATLSGLLSGPLMYAMSYFDGKHGLHDWQYLFIFEGIPTILLSFISYIFLFDDLQKVKWLSDEQKLLQTIRMTTHQKLDLQAVNSTVNLTTFKIVLFDWKTWAFAFVFLLNSINMTSITVFAPTLIDGFGFTTLNSQLLTAPPCAVATVSVLLGGYLTGRYNKRSPLLFAGSIIIAIGYLCLLILRDKLALYGTLFLIPTGIGIQAAAAIGWSAINYPDLTVRAIAVAFVLMIGNLVFGLVFNLVTALISAFLSSMTGFLLYRENCRLSKHPNEKEHFRYFY